MTQIKSTNCPCGSENAYANCCEPLIKGKSKAETAEKLLRARYSAFAKSEIKFILDSHHSRTKGEIKETEVKDWSEGSNWLGLKIIKQEGGQAADETGKIVFQAQFAEKKTPEKIQDHFELSDFEKENGEWKFVDAQLLKPGPYVREAPKLGRNDPCHCGSGKKLKKCHGE